ncbi:MAG: hypothetical protein J6J16_01115 [Lachnospiraceae bacterium]|nr:hypothetical protein [Lachnospiraceae bacterium]
MDYYDKLRNARAFIVLLAALITLVLNLKYKRELLDSLIIILIVIIIFFVISTVALKLIDKILHMEVNKEEVGEEETEGDEESEESEETTETE